MGGISGAPCLMVLSHPSHGLPKNTEEVVELSFLKMFLLSTLFISKGLVEEFGFQPVHQFSNNIHILAGEDRWF